MNASTITPIARVRGSSQADPPAPFVSSSTTGSTGVNARTAIRTVARATTAMRMRCTGTGTANPAATTPSPAPMIAPKEKPAWKRGITVRPMRRSTSAPSTFMATSQTPLPKP